MSLYGELKPGYDPRDANLGKPWGQDVVEWPAEYMVSYWRWERGQIMAEYYKPLALQTVQEQPKESDCHWAGWM